MHVNKDKVRRQTSLENHIMCIYIFAFKYCYGRLSRLFKAKVTMGCGISDVCLGA